MKELGSADEPCYAARLAWPFVRVLKQDGRLPPGAVSWLEQADGDQRVPIRVVHQLLEAAEKLTRDPALGVRAAKETAQADGGALYYAMSTAESMGARLTVLKRYARLVNDTLEVHVEEQGERALVRVGNPIVLPKVALDFQLCSMVWRLLSAWPDDMPVDIDVWFPYPEPAQLDAYRATLPNVRLHFGGDFSGFVVSKQLLAAPQRTADRSLHQIVSRHAEHELAALPRTKSLGERVREHLINDLASGNANAIRIAKKLEMSRRTLNRRLEQEQTSFRILLDEVRKQLALRYLSTRDLSIPDIALLTGFSEAAAFHRAFKRWTDQTPSEYRRAHRGR
ncbi:MAG: AraC family transcriptional regulator ligand-binding domain-containing protein [Myxococcales bacterium]